MEISSSFHKYSEGVLAYEELLLFVYQYMQDCSLEEKLSVNELLLSHFPLFSHNRKAITLSSDQLAGLSIGMTVLGLYTITGPVVQTPCFYEYSATFCHQEYSLRLLKTSFAESEYEEAFFREYTLSEVFTASLNKCVHCCISTKIPFLVYQHPKSISAKEYLLRNPGYDLSFVRHISLQFCSLISQIHTLLMSHSGIHLDLFSFSTKGIFVRDFGVEARLYSLSTDLPRMRYASPEHFEHGYLDAKTDVYGLGIILYRLCTGTFPFVGKSKEEVKEWCLYGNRLDLPFPETINPDIQQVICTALHIEPMLRYDSAILFKEALCAATSQIGWFVFDRQLLPSITNRICTSILLKAGKREVMDFSTIAVLGDLYPSWQLHNGLILLNSISDEIMNRFADQNKEEVVAFRPFAYPQFKKLQTLGAYDEIRGLLSLMETGEEFLLGAFVYSSILVLPTKSEEFFSKVLTYEPSFSLLIKAADFARWHLLDETRSRKIVKQLEELCETSSDVLQIAQASLAFFADEEEASRLLHRYIQSFTEEEFFTQIQALHEVVLSFGSRPEFIRWGVRLEENCPINGFELMKEVWLVLGVPKRAQKMQQRLRERLKDATQCIVQGFVSLDIPIVSMPEDEQEMMAFIEKGERLMILAQRKKELVHNTNAIQIFAHLSQLPLEEEAIATAEQKYEQWLKEREFLEPRKPNEESTKEQFFGSQGISTIDDIFEEEEMSQEEVHHAVPKRTFQLVGIWVLLILIAVLVLFVLT